MYTTDKLTVLIVDDSVQVRMRLSIILYDLGHMYVLHAGTYKEACHWLKTTKTDLVLLDIGLPDKNGIELLEWVSHQYPEIKVIMISNYADPHYRKACMSGGALYFFDKSNEFEQLVRAIEHIRDDLLQAKD
jgi:DNA-binding NarL/FixJ family response regulator